MKFKFTNKIEISVEDELPLLAYDLNKVSTRHYHTDVSEILSELVNSEITNGTYSSKVNGKVYTVSITNKVHSIE